MTCPHGKTDRCARCQREWYGKAAAAGFVDLEGPTGEGALSDRGNLHPVSESPEEHDRLAHRIEDGSAYTAWAESVMRDGPRFASPEQREVWRLHAAGASEREIATALTISKTAVNTYLANTRKRVSKVSKVKRWRNEKRHREMQARALARRCDPETLTSLVALMLRASAPA